MSISAPGQQASFDDLGRLLRDTPLCVVDLETTGASPAQGSRITEIGAVLVRGGEVLGEFQTLVNPDTEIPAYISVLTGITTRMVIEAPRMAEVLPSFLEFARGAVLVAHNAPFDLRFLRHAAAELEIPWPRADVIDTAVLARRVLLRDEVPNVKLATLAAHVRADTTPTHRALDDARATVDVLHFLIGRVGSLGVDTLEELRDLTAAVAPEQRRKRHLADRVPDAPGVYLFRGRDGEVLYVGTSRRLRSRVRSYFTRAESRTRMGQMLMLAERVDTVVCATALEAQVRELRLIAAHRPRYNRRSRFPERQTWIRLTDEAWPRFSLVREVRGTGSHLGPFGSRQRATEALDALHEAFTLRRCADRLGRRPRGTACALAGLGRCLSPCDGSVTDEAYAAEVERARRAVTGDPADIVDALRPRLERAAAAERYEEAALWRDRLLAILQGVDRAQRLAELATVPELVAAAPHPDGWEMHVVRFGRLVAAGVLPRGRAYRPWLETLRSTAECVEPAPAPTPAALIEETEAIRRWLLTDGIRVVDGVWVAAAHSAARHLDHWQPRAGDLAHLDSPGARSARAARAGATTPRVRGRR